MALVTFETVAQAADALAKAGQRTSVRVVTEALGGGSPNDVLPFLREWKAGRPLIKPSERSMNPRISAVISEEIEIAAATAAAAAEEKAASVEEDLQAVSDEQNRSKQHIARLTAELEQATNQVTDLLEQLKNVGDDASRAADSSAKQIESLKADVAAERAKSELLTSSLAKSEVRLEVLPKLESQIAKLLDDLDIQKGGKVLAEQRVAVLVAQVESLTNAENKSEAKIESLDSRLMVAEQKAAEFSQKAALMEERLQVAKGEKDSLMAALEKSKAVTESFQESLEKEKATVATMVAELEKAKKVVESLEKEKAAATVVEKKKPGRPKKESVVADQE